MVVLDEAPDGVVTLRFGPPDAPDDEVDYFRALDRIAQWPVPFALITVFAARGKLSPEADRNQALWFKATRARLNETCRALAIVRPGDPARSAQVFGKLWSFPVAVFEDEAEAQAFLAPHVPGRQA
ncbi:hypothetical protein J8J14_16225 [Roseomonas sp. SSH11]|uniref:STAS/SEC14 domain-containing protein n=1 Tax=Pararoseomonas baculiformis TaxID=2820812 RepID=A0ABS4AHH5_9PROT|nr:hypothetical protein [Pararoseomonas baculiformis]MBP0446321.1 hypothetical protein [Pararoseomonas baculiformis]